MSTTLQRSKLTPDISGWVGGVGPTLLLIHGVGMNADYWSNLIPLLQPRCRLVLIDLPGHGESPCLSEATASISNYTDRVSTILSEQDEPVFVVGHSMGAMICVDLARRYGSSVAGFAALNGIFERDPDATKAVRLRASELDADNAPSTAGTLSRWFGEEPRTGINGHAARQCHDWLSNINPKGYQQAYRAFANSDGPLREELKQLNCPALYLTGQHEPNSTPAMSAAMAELTEQGTVGIVPNAKHMMSMTHGEEVSQQLMAFMARVGFIAS